MRIHPIIRLNSHFVLFSNCWVISKQKGKCFQHCHSFIVYLPYILLKSQHQNLYYLLFRFWNVVLTLGSRAKTKKEEKSGTSQDGKWSGEKKSNRQVYYCDLEEISNPHSHQLRVGIFCVFCCCETSYFCDCEKSYDHYFIFIFLNPDPVKCLPQTQGYIM